MDRKNQSTNAQHMGTSWNIPGAAKRMPRLCKAVIQDTLIKYILNTCLDFSMHFSVSEQFHTRFIVWHLHYCNMWKSSNCVDVCLPGQWVVTGTWWWWRRCRRGRAAKAECFLEEQSCWNTPTIHTTHIPCPVSAQTRWSEIDTHTQTKKQSKINSNCSKTSIVCQNTIYDLVTI